MDAEWKHRDDPGGLVLRAAILRERRDSKMTAKIQVRRDTTENWTTNSSVVINSGEIAYDTDLNQIKIGSGATWASTPWLGSTLPTITVTSSDLNDTSNRVPGRYQFTASAGSPTNGPITFAALDGMIAVSVTAHGNTLVQRLSTEGDGTSAFPPKHYIRMFDGGASTWRGWVPLNVWGISSTEGTALVAKTIESKDTLTVAGASTLTGNVVIGGTMSVPTSTAAAPGIFHAGDSNTGIAFPTGPDSVIIATSGNAAITVGSSGGVTLLNNLTAGGTITSGGTIDASNNKVIQVANPTAATDAVNKQYLESVRIGSVAVLTTVNAALTQTIGSTTSGVFTLGTPAATDIRSTAGTWVGIVGNGSGQFGRVVIDTTSATYSAGNVTGISVVSASWWFILTRTA